MKTMTCKQLGGACDKEFHAKTFEEMAEMSKKHGMEMYKKGDEEHIKVMREMKELIQKNTYRNLDFCGIYQSDIII